MLIDTNHIEFFQYLDGCLDKLANENKGVVSVGILILIF